MVYDQFRSIENATWEWDETVDFEFTMEDTATYHNIQIQLRHSVDYPLSNLYMFVQITGPSGRQLTDTINFILARHSGEWIGKGIGSIREIGYLYKENTLFPESGDYHIAIEQGMRLREVPVSEVGVRVTKVIR